MVAASFVAIRCIIEDSFLESTMLVVVVLLLLCRHVKKSIPTGCATASPSSFLLLVVVSLQEVLRLIVLLGFGVGFHNNDDNNDADTPRLSSTRRPCRG